MNYRHAYHAGNIGDVLKHLVLARILVYLQRKETPFRIIDTHAGIGLYDLTAPETQKTGEWHQGVERVLAAETPDTVRDLMAPWLDTVLAENEGHEFSVYPGSPLLSRRLMRRQDRLTLTELHPQDFAKLERHFGGDHRVKVIHLDGWLALGSFVPPKEKRGLVLIDPAYEVPNEFQIMANHVCKAWKRWSNGVYAMWYPMKDMSGIRRLHETLREAGIRDVLALDLSVSHNTLDGTMKGSGMTIINPPFTLTSEMQTLLPWLRDTLAESPRATWNVEQVIPE